MAVEKSIPAEAQGLIDQIADSMVANAIIKNEVDSLIDGYVEEGLCVESARDDLKRILGQSVLKADGKLVFAESYVNKEQITRPAGQVLDFALRELIVARPHYQPPAGPEPDEEQECFGDNAVTFLKARGDFLKKHGPAYADARAVAWGLTGIGDFKNKGVAPVNDKEKPKDKAAQIADARRDNPWAVDSGDAVAMRLEVINGKRSVKVNGQTLTGTAGAAAAAHAAGKTITGQPLRQRVNNF